MPGMSRDRWIAVLMITPSIILLAIFVYGFIGQTAYLSMTDWKGLAENPQINFIGFKNFQSLFTSLLNARFRTDLVNTVFFTLFFLAACLGLGLLMAILIDQKVRGESVFRTIFLFPMALSFVVTGTIWRWLFQPNGGLNVLPTTIGLAPLRFEWFTDRSRALTFSWADALFVVALVVIIGGLDFAVFAWRRKNYVASIIGGLIGLGLAGYLLSGGSLTPVTISEKHGMNVAILSIVIAATWQMSGYTMAMYLAGLRGISEELREAARVDGCNEFQVYRYIVLPQLQPITLSAVIILGHISLKIFDLIYVLAGGDPQEQISVPGITMYLTAFRANNFSLGAAIAIIMLLMVAIVIVPYLISQLRSEPQS
jgi:glucose/mannose transport system permease protein